MCCVLVVVSCSVLCVMFVVRGVSSVVCCLELVGCYLWFVC